MEPCYGDITYLKNEAIELTRLEPVIIEVEEGDTTSSHLILFEMNCKIGMDSEEMYADGEIQETVYELEERNFE